MSGPDPWEPWDLDGRKARERDEFHRGLAPESARGLRSPPPVDTRVERRQIEGSHWAERLYAQLREARTVPQILWVGTTFAEERSFAAGVAAGLLGAVVDTVVAPYELIRMFVLADLYELWQKTLSAARGLPGALGYVAFKTLLGHEYFGLQQTLRESYEARERFVAQLERLVEHPLYFMGELAESTWESLKSLWNRYQTLRAMHDIESQYQAGVIFGRLVADVLLAYLALRAVVVAASKLAKELPDLFAELQRMKLPDGGGSAYSEELEKLALKLENERKAKLPPAAAEPEGAGPASSKGPEPNPPPGGAEASPEPANTGPTPNPPPASQGNPVPRNQSTCTGHPVDVATGKVFTDKLDLELPGLLGFRWERVWFSTSTYAGPLGNGWHHSYDAALHVRGDGVDYHTDDGRLVKLPWLEAGETHFDRTERVTLARDARGYSLRARDHQRYVFSESRAQPSIHRLVSIEHPTGRSLQLQRDELGGLVRCVDGAGRLITITRDGAGRIASLSVPDLDDPGQPRVVLQYAYDSSGNLTQVTDALGQVARYRYGQRQLVQETDRTGLSFYFTYDGSGPDARCLRTWGDDGIYDHKLDYDVGRGITTVEDSLGVKTQYEHRNGLVLRKVDPLGAVTRTEYDAFNQKTLEVDALGHETRYAYDPRGNLVQVVRPDGLSVRASYDASDRLQTVVEGDRRWSYLHDAAGRLLERVDPLGARTRYGYEGASLIEIIDPGGGRYEITRDAQGNLGAVRAPDGSVRRWTHDVLGRVRSVIDPLGNTQRIERDVLGRATRLDEPDGNTRTLEYDGEGRIVRVKDKLHDVRLTYRGLGRLASRREASATVYFDYDTEERLVAIHNEEGRAYRFELEPTGEIETASGFDGARRSYARDLLGRVTEVRRPSGSTTQLRYDALGNVLEVRHSDGDIERYAYVDDGTLLRADNSSCQLLFERDLTGRVLCERRDAHWLKSDYDAVGNRIRVQSSSGLDQRIARDRVGRTQAVDAGAFRVQFTRDLLGLELERSLPGGARSRWRRDQLGRPIQHEVRSADQTVRSATYTWDVDGRLLQLVDSDHGLVRYGYDTRARLGWARYVDGTAELRVPDAVSNLYRAEDRSDRKYGPSGELLEARDRRGRITRYAYDADGNLAEKLEAGSQRWRYAWNAAGQLVSVTRPDGGQVGFRYDALGRRIEKHYRGQVTHFVWDGDVPLHEWVEGALEPPAAAGVAADADYLVRQREAELQEHLAQGPPQRGSLEAPITWLFEPESFAPMAKLSAADQLQSIVTDSVGTPKLMLDRNARPTWSASLGTYGDFHSLKGKRQACPFRWQGQYEDAETGLYYNRFRYYDPNGGQYISQDPIGLVGGTALYAYCADPLGTVDPLGLCAQPAPAAQRLPQDVNVDPNTPAAKPLNRPIGSSPTQNQRLQADIKQVQANGGTDIRVNQQQVNAQGARVGTNRPDLQYTDANGVRQYVEYDTPSSGRGPAHASRILANDPAGNVTLITQP